jgi:hypothetical protein
MVLVVKKLKISFSYMMGMVRFCEMTIAAKINTPVFDTVT